MGCGPSKEDTAPPPVAVAKVRRVTSATMATDRVLAIGFWWRSVALWRSMEHGTVQFFYYTLSFRETSLRSEVDYVAVYVAVPVFYIQILVESARFLSHNSLPIVSFIPSCLALPCLALPCFFHTIYLYIHNNESYPSYCHPR
jgi:hypothetical protein